ncbi:MAG: FAD-dependent oxidoreductase [bacterium]
MKQKVAIIGSGPAGLAAAIYTSRAELETTIYAGEEPGGQLTKTTEVENYPGVIGKTGPELMMEMQKQAEKMGAKVEYGTIESLESIKDKYDGVILAMGAKSKMLGIGEEKYYGKGFSTCAVCDAPFYKGKNVYVVGGGDVAIEDAWALTKFASSVTMLVRRNELSASLAMQKRVLENPDKIRVMWETNLKEVRGEKVSELVIEQKGKEVIVPAEGLFMAIGHEPATAWLQGSGVELDEKGYIKTGLVTGESWLEGYPTMTTLEGVVAAGDCVDYRYRQAATASGMGVMAAIDLEKWLESGKNK